MLVVKNLNSEFQVFVDGFGMFWVVLAVCGQFWLVLASCGWLWLVGCSISINLIETSLNSSTQSDDNRLMIDGYHLIRSDHSTDSRKGGVCML